MDDPHVCFCITVRQLQELLTYKLELVTMTWVQPLRYLRSTETVMGLLLR